MSFPSKIQVSGLPFVLQGWNSTYYKTGEVSDSCPVYRLDSYTLYYMISIIGARIMRINGIWVLQRAGDAAPLDINQYGASSQSDPFGYWSNNAFIKPV